MEFCLELPSQVLVRSVLRLLFASKLSRRAEAEASCFRAGQDAGYWDCLVRKAVFIDVLNRAALGDHKSRARGLPGILWVLRALLHR